MKALSRKRRGRPRNETAARTESGQISRASEPANKLALEARARMHKIAIDKAHDQQAGTFLGRLHMAYQDWLKGKAGVDQPEHSISTAQFYGLNFLKEMHNDYLKATGCPGAYYEPRFSRSVSDDEARAKWEGKAKERWQSVRDAIQAEQNYHKGNLWAALNLCVVQEQTHFHLIGDLRTLGNIANRLLGRD